MEKAYLLAELGPGERGLRQVATHVCPPHHWIINSSNVGRCLYCPEVRDFGKLLRAEDKRFKVPARRGSEATKGAVRRGRPRKRVLE